MKEDKKDVVFEKFKQLAEEKGLQIDFVDSTGLIHLKKDGIEIKVSLDNARRDFNRDGDTTYVVDLVRSLEKYHIELPSWPAAQTEIYFSLFPSDFDFEDFIHDKVTDDIDMVYVHRKNGNFSWISATDVTKWGITVEELRKQALENTERLAKKIQLESNEIEKRKLYFVNTEETSLKASLLFTHTFKASVSKEIGYPYYAVLPVRDFCYVFSERDYDFFIGKVGSVVVKEYKESSYPITTEVLKFTSDGVEAVGTFPLE